MNKLDLILMGLQSLKRRKLRTFLTILGVVIGTASIIIMMSLGYGIRYSFQNDLNKMGNLTVITVMPGGRGGPDGGNQKFKSLDDSAVASFGKISGVEAVTPILESYIKLVSGKYIANIPIRGIYPETMKCLDMEVSEGRLLEKNDGATIVFGSTIPFNFMDPKSANRYYDYGPPKNGQKPKVDVLKDNMSLTFDMSYNERVAPYEQNKPKTPSKLYKVKGVGILKESNQEKDYYAYMNINELKKIIKDNKKNESKSDSSSKMRQREESGYSQALVKVKNSKDVKDVQQKIKDMGFTTYSLNDYLNQLEKTSNTLQVILGGIGAISLLVAAIGITNTMVMSIYERTREIGIMKVIGASLKDIKKLFLFESGVIGFLGGVFGIIFSYIISFILNFFGKNFSKFVGPTSEGAKLSIIPIWLALFALAFSTMIGLISGYSPAKRAMKLSALEAIKTE